MHRLPRTAAELYRLPDIPKARTGMTAQRLVDRGVTAPAPPSGEGEQATLPHVRSASELARLDLHAASAGSSAEQNVDMPKADTANAALKLSRPTAATVGMAIASNLSALSE